MRSAGPLLLLLLPFASATLLATACSGESASEPTAVPSATGASSPSNGGDMPSGANDYDAGTWAPEPDPDATTAEPSWDGGWPDGDGSTVEEDAAATDAQGDGQADAQDDAQDDGGAIVNGCTEAEYAAHDESGAKGVRTITFAKAAPATQYDPNCMRVAKGQTVTWTGDFALFPLDPHGGAAPSPIQKVNTGNKTSVRFETEGTYGFWSSASTAVMFGAIDVKP